MVKKILFISTVLFGLLFSQMPRECFADATTQLAQAETYMKDGQYEQADGVKMVSAFWHDVTPIEGRHQVAHFTNDGLTSSFQALRSFYPGIQDVPYVQYVRPVYYGFDHKIKEPGIVWEVCFEGDRRAFWDSVAKQAPNYFENIRKQRE